MQPIGKRGTATRGCALGCLFWTLAAGNASAQEARPVDVPAQALDAAIAELAAETGWQVSAANDLVAGQLSTAVQGTLTLSEALTMMTAGTDLAVELIGAEGATLRPANSDSADGGPILLDQLLVQGIKVERSFLDTPTSVGIVTSEQIQDFVITDTFDGFNTLGNVRRLNTDGGNDSFQIRGLGGDGIASIANPANAISLIIDGATQNSEGLRRGARSTWDLEQVEVLRGPQSGLYGRAALAGAVVLESKDPTFFWETAARFGFGTPSAVGGSFMVSGPIVEDQVAFRISGDVQTDEKDIVVTDPLNESFIQDEYRNLRAKLLIEPKAIPELSALFTFNHAFDDTANPLVSEPFFDRVFTEAGLGSEEREIEVNNYVGDVTYELADGLALRSISAFIDTDLTISSVPGSTTFQRNDLRDGRDITQEFVLALDDLGGSGVSGIIGAFYGRFKQNSDTNILADFGAFFGDPSGELSIFQDGTSVSKTESYALYADLSYNVFGPFTVIGGIRYQHDTVSLESDTRNFDFSTFSLVDSSVDVEASFDVFLPKAGLSFEIDETQNITASVRRGYRAGYTETVLGTGEENEVDPEFVWTYELAYRYQSRDGGLSLGATGFFNDYSDQQIVLVDETTFATRTVNAGDSRSYGLELEGRYDTGTGLSVFGALGLLKTEIVDLENSDCAPSGGNCSGNEFPEAPNVTLAVGGVYRHLSGVFASADVNYTGAYFSNGDINNTAAREIDGYFLANASVGYETENFRAQLYVRNLFDNDYLTTIDSSLTRAAVGDGRTFGGELSVRF
ncbi:MAG: TonB-dependent receptor [Pseudomonadota bacterium]